MGVESNHSVWMGELGCNAQANGQGRRLLTLGAGVLALVELASCRSDEPGSSAETEIGPKGGSVTGPDGVELIVPAGALKEPIEVAITKAPNDAPAAPAGVKWVAGVYAITPHGTEFAEPVTLRLPFDAELVPEELAPTPFKAESGAAFAPVSDAKIGTDSIEIELSELSFFTAGIPSSFLGTVRPTDVAAYPGGGAVVVALDLGTTRVIKVDESGVIAWERTTQGTEPRADASPRVAVGPTGNVYVATATTDDEEGMHMEEAEHLRITSYNASGDVRDGWPIRVNLGTYNSPTDIVTDAHDNIYYVGTRETFDSVDPSSHWAFLGANREDASVVWPPGRVDMGSTDQLSISSQSVSLARNGSVYMSATGARLTAFDTEGAVMDGYPKQLSQASISSQMVVDHTGICYVLGSSDKQLYAINPNGTDVDGFPQAVALPSEGTFSILPHAVAGSALAVSITGNLYVVGTAFEQPGNPGSGYSTDVYLQSLNPTGAQRSGFPVYLATPGVDTPVAVALDDAGANAWVAWYVEGNRDGDPSLGFVTRVPAD